MEKKIAGIGRIDVQIAVSVGVCLLLSAFVPRFQTMTACIATILCVQDDHKLSWKAGLTRLIVTAVGGALGILAVLLDGWMMNRWAFMAVVALGALLTLLGCRLAKVPPFNARIGAVTFILVSLTLTGTARIDYALFRLLSTLYGVAVVLAVTALSDWVGRRRARGKAQMTAGQ